MKYTLFILLVSLPLVARAITWGELKVDDPILKGEKCSVHEPASYGSYIYGFPSKYDQVFWPLTDQNGIWFCEKSGFTAFIGDFSELGSGEAETIRDFLTENPPADSTIGTKLDLLEKIYALRTTERVFSNMLLRTLARWYQELGDLDKADSYRKDALADIELSLQGELDEVQRMEYLYVAANYTRQFGDEEASDNYLSKLSSFSEKVTSEDAKGFAEYLKEFSSDTQLIEPGGTLDPKLSE